MKKATKTVFKTVGIIAFLAMMLFTIVSCEGPMGPAGPAGADGKDGTNGAPGATGPQGPAGPSNTYTVTFSAGTNATVVPSQTVLKTQFAYDPQYTSDGLNIRKAISTPTAAGLYKGAFFLGWKKQSSPTETEKVYNSYEEYYGRGGYKELFQFNTPITENITLIGVWIKESTDTSRTTVKSALDWISEYGHDNNYIIAISNSEDFDDSYELKGDNVDITIIGINNNRNISFNDTDGSLFTLGEKDKINNGINLTIGNNITLKGVKNTTQDSPVIQVNQGTTFTMLPGSKISENINNEVGGTGAVKINGGTFIMEGGNIDDIKGTMTVSVSNSYCDNSNYYGSFVMKGGTITRSTINVPGFDIFFDVFLEVQSSLTLSGNTSIVAGLEFVKVDDEHPAAYSPITIDPSWSGSDLKLHLLGVNNDSTITTTAQLKTKWNGKQIFDTPLTSAQTSNITFGKLIVMDNFLNDDFTGSVSTAGVLTIN